MGKLLISKTEFGERCGVSGGSVTKFIRGKGKPTLVGSRIDFNHPIAQRYYAEKTAPPDVPPAPGIDVLFEDALAHCQETGRWTASSVQRGMGIGYSRAVKIFGQLQAAGHVPEGLQGKPPAPATEQAPPPAPAPAKAPAKKPRRPKRDTSWQDDEALIEIPDDIGSLADLTLRELIEKFGTSYRFLDWLKALKEIEAVNEKRIKNAQSRGQLISRHLVEVGVIDQFNSAHVRLMTDGAKAITAAVLAKHQAKVGDVEIEAYVADVVGSFLRPVKSKIERNLASVDSD